MPSNIQKSIKNNKRELKKSTETFKLILTNDPSTVHIFSSTQQNCTMKYQKLYNHVQLYNNAWSRWSFWNDPKVKEVFKEDVCSLTY